MLSICWLIAFFVFLCVAIMLQVGFDLLAPYLFKICCWLMTLSLAPCVYLTLQMHLFIMAAQQLSGTVVSYSTKLVTTTHYGRTRTRKRDSYTITETHYALDVEYIDQRGEKNTFTSAFHRSHSKEIGDHVVVLKSMNNTEINLFLFEDTFMPYWIWLCAGIGTGGFLFGQKIIEWLYVKQKRRKAWEHSPPSSFSFHSYWGAYPIFQWIDILTPSRLLELSLVLCVYLMRQTHRFITAAQQLSGTVVSYKEKVGRKHNTYALNVEYRDQSGEKHSLTSGSYSSIPSKEIGDQVIVLKRKCDSQVKLLLFEETFMLYWIWLCVGVGTEGVLFGQNLIEWLYI